MSAAATSLVNANAAEAISSPSFFIILILLLNKQLHLRFKIMGQIICRKRNVPFTLLQKDTSPLSFL